MKSIIYKFFSARDMILHEGWPTFFKNLWRSFFGFPCEKLYIYEHYIKEKHSADFIPDLRDLESFMLRNKQEMIKLIEKGYRFGSRKTNNLNALDHGAIVFCAFVNKELAHIGRLALTEQAKHYVDSRPFKVDFEKGEACTGNTWTSRKFRGKGLMKFSYFQRFEYLRKLGITISRNSVEISNIASNRVHTKFEHKICAQAEYRQLFFFFRFWKELPVVNKK